MITYKLLQTGESSYMVKRNGFNPFANRKCHTTWDRKKVNQDYPYLLTKNYIKTLKRYRENFANVNLERDKCAFWTLTNHDEMSFNDFKKEVKNFISLLRYHHPGVKYISAIECSENSDNLYHCHLILFFPETTPHFERAWLKKN